MERMGPRSSRTRVHCAEKSFKWQLRRLLLSWRASEVLFSKWRERSRACRQPTCAYCTRYCLPSRGPLRSRGQWIIAAPSHASVRSRGEGQGDWDVPTISQSGGATSTANVSARRRPGRFGVQSAIAVALLPRRRCAGTPVGPAPSRRPRPCCERRGAGSELMRGT